MRMQVTALQIASLKKVNKRSQIMLLDKNGSTSKVIAKELARKGFKKIRVIQVSTPYLAFSFSSYMLLCWCSMLLHAKQTIYHGGTVACLPSQS